MNHQFDSSYAAYKIENSIAVVTYKSVTVDLILAKQIVQERLLFYDGKEYPTLADIRDANSFTKEARDYFAKEGTKGIRALAIITGNYLTVITANLFITFSRPIIPTKVFNAKEQAMKWLNRFVAVEVSQK